jgi:hypothetical protein
VLFCFGFAPLAIGVGWGLCVGGVGLAPELGPTKPVGQMVRHSRRVWRRTGHCTTTARQVFARHQNSSITLYFKRSLIYWLRIYTRTPDTVSSNRRVNLLWPKARRKRLTPDVVPKGPQTISFQFVFVPFMGSQVARGS